MLKNAKPVKEFLFPPICPACQCRSITTAGAYVCDNCAQQLVPFPEPRCRYCGGVVDGILDSCGECLESPSRAWHHAVSVFAYGGYIRDLIHQFKYRGNTALAPYFAAEMTDNWLQFGMRRPDMVVPIPMHWRRILLRGYNQAAILSKLISRKMKVPIVPAVRRNKHSRRQAFLDQKQRQQNVKDIFCLSDKTKPESQHILLIDDILTTGATLDMAARLLLSAGAGEVYVLTLARG